MNITDLVYLKHLTKLASFQPSISQPSHLWLPMNATTC